MSDLERPGDERGWGTGESESDDIEQSSENVLEGWPATSVDEPPEEPAGTRAAVAHPVGRAPGHPDHLARLASHSRSPTVMSIGPSRICHISPRCSCFCSDSRWPGSTVMILTVTVSLETNCWN